MREHPEDGVRVAPRAQDERGRDREQYVLVPLRGAEQVRPEAIPAPVDPPVHGRDEDPDEQRRRGDPDDARGAQARKLVPVDDERVHADDDHGDVRELHGRGADAERRLVVDVREERRQRRREQRCAEAREARRATGGGATIVGANACPRRERNRPPDVGGPASRAAEVARWLHEHGWAVEVVTTASAPPARRPFCSAPCSRTLPPGARHLAGARLVASRARRADVVYTTGTFGRSAAGASLVRRPYVVKLTADPAFERARRRGLVGGDVDEFQSGGGGMRGWVLRRARDAELRGAAHVLTPSASFRELALRWGVSPDRVSVLPNPAPRLPSLPSRERRAEDLAVDGATFAFAGRLTAQKSLETALDALARIPKRRS